jgi:CDP-6-deoxy-D-xylo-4-hexulose-3-dehydrase
MIELAKNTIDKQDIDRLIEWLKTYPRLTKGKVTVEYEDRWSTILGSRHAVFVNSGSSANLLMLYTLIEMGKIKVGDKVIVPALSWSTDLAPVHQLGLQPVLCDCNLEDLSVDIEHLERLIADHSPKVLLLVSVLGLVPNMDALLKICNDNKVILLEDTCESLGSKYKGKTLGTFGLMSSFSTYFGHHLSTIEGGMVCTDDTETYNFLKSLRSHGWARDMDPSYQYDLREEFGTSEFNEQYTFYYSGFNLRSTDLQAFIGLSQLDKYDKVMERRHANYNVYKKNLNDKFWRPSESLDTYVSNFAYPLIHPAREKIIEALRDNKIEHRPLICGSLGSQPIWLKRYGKMSLPNADQVHKFGMYLPNNQNTTPEEIKTVCDVVNRSVE